MSARHRPAATVLATLVLWAAGSSPNFGQDGLSKGRIELHEAAAAAGLKGIDFTFADDGMVLAVKPMVDAGEGILGFANADCIVISQNPFICLVPGVDGGGSGPSAIVQPLFVRLEIDDADRSGGEATFDLQVFSLNDTGDGLEMLEERSQTVDTAR